MKIEIQSPLLDNFYYMISAPFVWICMPFLWIWRTVAFLMTTGRLLGPLILVLFIWQLITDLDYSVSIFPVKEHVQYMRTKIITRVVVVIVLNALICLALNSRRSSNKGGFQPEKMHPGSPLLTKYLRPTFQAEIYGNVEGKWIKSGQAFLTKDVLITAHHVVHGYEQIRIVGPSNKVEVPAKMFTNVEGDVAMANIAQATSQYLGLTSGKLVDSEPSQHSGLFVSAVGFESATMGLLKPNPSFGFVTYEGSTVAGYSGAAYHNSDKIYGLHLGGSSMNLGYSSAYLSMLLRSAQEDSEEWLVSQASRTRKFFHQRSPFNPDEFRIRINGKYYLTDNEGIGRLMAVAQGVVMSDKADYDFESYQEEQTVESTASKTPVVKAPSKTFVDPNTTYNSPTATTSTMPVTQQQSEAFLGRTLVAATPDTGTTKAQISVPHPAPRPRLATISTSPKAVSDGRKQIAALANEVSAGITQFSKAVKRTNVLLTPYRSLKQSIALNENLASSQLISLKQKIDQLTQELGSITQSLS